MGNSATNLAGIRKGKLLESLLSLGGILYCIINPNIIPCSKIYYGISIIRVNIIKNVSASVQSF